MTDGWRQAHTLGYPVMPSATISHARPRATRTRRHRAHRSAARPLTGRALVALRGAPWAVRLIASAILLVAVWASVNGIVQAVRKPTEVFFPISGSLAKSPAETWRQYGPLFV